MSMLKFDDIHTAFGYVSFGNYGEHEAWLSPKKCEVFMNLDEMIIGEKPKVTEEELEAGDWIAIPDKRDLGLGKKLVFRFTGEHLAEYDWPKVDRIFSKRGAYANWKYFLDERGLLQKWYDYSNQAEIQALKKWLDLEQITYQDNDGSIVTPSASSEN